MQLNVHTIDKKKVLISILAFICLFLISKLFTQCENGKTQLATIEALQSDASVYKLKNGQLVVSQKTATLEIKQLKENVLLKDNQLKEMSKKFSKVTNVQTIKIKTTIPKIDIAFEKPISKTEVDTITNELKFERTGVVFKEWYSLGYNVTQDSLEIEPFNTWTEIKRVDGFKRKWFLGKQTLTSDITLTNPFIEISEVKTYNVAIPKAWHETRAFNIGVGLISGYLLFKK